MNFPKIDDYNLFSFTASYGNADSVGMAFDQSIGENNQLYQSPEARNERIKLGKLPAGTYLCDSRKIFKIIRNQQIETEAIRKKLKEMRLLEKSKSNSQ